MRTRHRDLGRAFSVPRTYDWGVSRPFSLVRMHFLFKNPRNNKHYKLPFPLSIGVIRKNMHCISTTHLFSCQIYAVNFKYAIVHTKSYQQIYKQYKINTVFSISIIDKLLYLCNLKNYKLCPEKKSIFANSWFVQQRWDCLG